MSDSLDQEETPPTEQERNMLRVLSKKNLPTWEYKALAARFTQGHRGILDLDLDFPEEYLLGPAPECYVWKRLETDGPRIHAYVDINGNCFHLRWQDEKDSLAQKQPTHHDGVCEQATCHTCEAVDEIARRFRTTNSSR